MTGGCQKQRVIKRKELVVRIFLNHYKLLKACRGRLKKNDIAFLDCTVDEFRSLATKDGISDSSYLDICRAIAEKRFFFRNPKESRPHRLDFIQWIRKNGWHELRWRTNRKLYTRRRARQKMKESGQFDLEQIIL